jgi:hypothetical protein
MTPDQGPLRVTLAELLLLQRPDARTAAVLCMLRGRTEAAT